MRFHYHLIGMTGLLAVCPAQAANKPAIVRQALDTSTEITLPPEAAARAKAAPESIRAGRNSAGVKALKIVRQFSMAQLGKNPEILLGTTRVSMAPVFANPAALPNIAKRLRTTPQLVTVVAEGSQISEVEVGPQGRGLQIWHFLSYQIKPGVCGNVARRSELAKGVALVNGGTGCSNRLTNQARGAAFANPKDPHFIADPAKRAKALADANLKAAQTSAAIATDIAQLRTTLASVEGRAQIDAERGPGEATRLSALSDDQLTEEMINSGLTKIEQVYFVPTNRLPMMKIRGSTAPKGEKPESVTNTDKPLEPHVFLTGFTLGRDYSWGERVEKTINLCVFSCKKTYFAEVHAGFDYAFGLRFPIKLGGTFHHRQQGTTQSASVTTDFAPINGSAEDYASTGLPSEQVKEGKELVAEFKASAGASYNIPIYPSIPIPDLSVGKDFTEGLPAPFTLGQFRPPTPGESCPPAPAKNCLKPLIKIFDDFDLIGGRANFKVIGARIFPAIKVELTSDSLKFILHDLVKDPNTPIVLDHSGITTTDLGIDPASNTSKFSIGEPEYTLSFLLTPGLVGNLFIDVGVWSNEWNFPAWFPQLALKIPQEGKAFSCHGQTVCSRIYEYSATVAKDSAGAKADDPNLSAFENALNKWSEGFSNNWRSQCADDGCKFVIVLIAADAKAVGQKKYNANKATTMADMASTFEDAIDQAFGAWGKGFQRQWNPQCADVNCKIAIGGIIIGAQGLGKNKTNANPATPMDEITPIFADAAKQAQAAVNQSKQREQIEKQHKTYMALVQVLWSSKCADQLCRTNTANLSQKMLAELIAQSKENPEASAGKIQVPVSNIYVPKFQAEIDASRARVGRRPTGVLSPSAPTVTNGRSAAPIPEAPPIYQNRAPVAEPVPEPAPPPVTQGRNGFPNFQFPTLAAPRPAPVVLKSTICRFTSGPRAGQDQDYAPMAPIPVGSNCQDGRGSVGSVVAP